MVEGVVDLVRLHPTATVLFTGHSLGAALATLGYVAFVEKMETLCSFSALRCAFGSVRTKLITVGSPRVGNQAFVAYVRSLFTKHKTESYRIVNGRDPVPHGILYSRGFRHLPTEVWIKHPNARTKEVLKCDARIGDPLKCSKGTLALRRINLHHMWAFGIFMGNCAGEEVDQAAVEDAVILETN